MAFLVALELYSEESEDFDSDSTPFIHVILILYILLI